MQKIILPLCGTQEGIWLADQVSQAGQKNTYVISHCIEFNGVINTEVLSQAIRQGLAEADTVTATFIQGDEGALQVLHADITAQDIPAPEIFACTTKAQALEYMWADTHADLPLDGNKPLYRQVIVLIKNNNVIVQTLWYQRYHHIMLDGFSFTALTRRIATLYSELLKGEAISPTPFTSVETVVDEYLAYQQSTTREKDQLFWKNYCADFPAASSLCARGAADEQATANLITSEHIFSVPKFNALRELAEKNRLTLADLLLGLIAAYLYRMTGQAQQIIGVPFMRRMGSAAISSVAPVVNVLPLRVDLHADMDWLAVAAQFKQALKLVRSHQRYDAEQIQRDLRKVGSGEKLYGAVINYKMFDYQLDFAGTLAITHHLATGPIDDFEFNLVIHGEHIHLELRADSKRYTQQELHSHGERIEYVLGEWLKKPAEKIAQLDVLTVLEKSAIDMWSCGHRFEHEADLRSVLDFLALQVKQNPAATALVCGAVHLTFDSLAAQVNQLTRLLIAQGAGPNCVVAVAIERSVDSVIAMFAVLNSGSTFLPLDLDYPADRMAMMCEDASPILLLSKAIITAELPQGIRRINLDADSIQDELQRYTTNPVQDSEQRGLITPDTVAYIIFTSGSTGRPKGVMNTHGALLNLLLSHRETIYQPALDAVRKKYPHRALNAAHTHSFSFDSSWLQIFWLLHGQALFIFDEETRRDAYALVKEIDRLQIDAMDLPPSFLAQMLSNGLMAKDRHQLSLILIGGEAAPAALWQQLREFTDLHAHNLYGPTEYTVDTVRACLADSEKPVIGRPIGNTSVYVLDARLQPVPIGVVGELYLSGRGIAKGYLARAGLTASRFVANPFSAFGECMYRSGDLVRWNNAGHLEYMGRTDDQVKVRGYRVEIGEVENALSLLPEVESAVVVAQAINNSHRLIGYCVVPGLTVQAQALSSANLLAALRSHLPDYMVPAALVILDQFPRNVSGKVDRKRLPAPLIHSIGGEAANTQEKLLCQQMATVLKIPKAGVEDDFFALGGDSISAIMLCTQLRKSGYELRPSAVFSQRNARLMAQAMHHNNPQEITTAKYTVPATQIADLHQLYGEFAAIAPVLPLQKGMLFHAQMGNKAGSYNAFTRVHFKGAVEGARLQQALNAVLSRYPQLFGLFDIQTGAEPVFLLPNCSSLNIDWPWQEHDLSGFSSVAKTRRVEDIEQTLLAQEYPTDKFGGLLNAALVHLDDQTHVLLLLVHHLVIDGWSTPLLLRDLLNAYKYSSTVLPQPKAQYAQLMHHLVSRDLTQSHALWQKTLAEVQPTLLFESIEPAAQVEEFSLKLPAQFTSTIMHEIRARGLTLNVVMQGVWAIVLSSFAARADVVFGTPVSGRTAAIEGIDEQVGLFLNTVPVRVQLHAHSSLWDQLPAMQQRHIELLEHDGLGLAEIQRIAGGATLFDTLLVVENYPDNEYLSQQLDGSDGKKLVVDDIYNRGYSHYPLALLVLPGDELTLLVENRGAVSNSAALAHRVEQLLRTLVEQPELAIARYPLQTAQEAEFIRAINATEQYVAPATLRSALIKQARRTPDAPALADAQHNLNYTQMRYQVETLAAQLINSGVKPGDIVAVALPRSVNLSIALMAVIEAGAAYLPLDMSYPDDRLLYMLGDANPRLLITYSDAKTRFTHFATKPELVLFDTLFAAGVSKKIQVDVTPNHPAYIIYTSGTTGRPKGVLVSHKAIVNRIEWMQHEYQLNPADVVLQKTPSSFDVSVWEFFWPLMMGASVFMAEPEAHRDPHALVQTIEQQGITCMHFVPSMLAIFTSNAKSLYEHKKSICSHLRLVFCSGEALTKAAAEEFSRYFNAQLHNLYGPTEAAVDVTYKPAFGDLTAGGVGVPIGRPVWNTQLRVLDQYLRPVPVGASGELYLCGVQLAMGYLGRADLTCARFIADPFANGERMYRTGDVVRWLDNGEVEYLGRADDQIKIRGQRIELGEIETLLLQQIEVTHAVVHAVVLNQNTSAANEDNRQLVAYIVLVDGFILDAEHLKARLHEQLPAHMVPVAYVELQHLPLSANGKLDRKALPVPSAQINVAKNGRLPVRGLETRLATIFAKVLEIEQVFADDDFFAIGGHSLLAMRLAAEIRRDLQRPISVGQIMTAPSVEKLAAQLNSDVMLNDFGNDGFDHVIRLREGQGAPLFCVYPGSGFAWQYSVLSRYLKNDQPIIGLQSPRPNGLIATSKTMDELLNKQLAVIRKEQPQGPYYLLGYSLGGTVAYGVAAKLREQGESVHFLGLLDTYPAEAHDWTDPQGAEAALGAEREQEQLLNDAIIGENQEVDELLRQEKEAMLSQIFANYKDAVRLLSQTQTADYDSEITLFIAEQSLPDYIQPVKSWQKHVGGIDVHSLTHCSHENIMSPESLETLGPLLNKLLERAQVRGEIAQLEKLTAKQYEAKALAPVSRLC